MSLDKFIFVILCLSCCTQFLAFCQVTSSSSSSSFERTLSCARRCTCRTEDPGFLVVNCSKKGLGKVPSDVPVNASVLLLDHNRIRVLKDEDFRRLDQLIVLDLSFNRINETGKDIFSGLQQLETLNLSYNPLPTRLQDGFFSKLSQLEELNLTSTRIEFNQGAFVNLTNLRVLVFRENRLFRFPRFLHQNKTLLPRLQELYLNRNSLEAIHHQGLESLEVLSLGDNKITTMYGKTLLGFKNLKYLTLYQNALITIDKTAFCSNSLRKLDLAFTRFRLTRRTRNVFNCIPNLEELSLVRCQVTDVRDSFRNTTKLRKLNLASTGFSDERLSLLRHLRALEWLSLQDNSIHALHKSMFETFSHSLKVLALGSNRITTVNMTSLPERLWKNLDKIDLSDNPFTCDCDLSWFLHWTSTTNVTISKWWKDPKQYKCSAPAILKDRTLVTVKRYLTEGVCFVAPKDWVLLAVLLLVITICSSSTIGSLGYRFRWYVKYWYFRYKIQQRQDQRSVQSQMVFRYDAFVSYSRHDSKWVTDELRRHLETEANLHLCIHDRDFSVGEDIAENVLQSIEDSRKVILIVSNAFAVSQWCHFELIMAQTRILKSDFDNLVLVLLEEIHESNLPPRLRFQMERQTYLEWTDRGVGQQLFWERLKVALDKSPESIINAHLPIQMFQSI